MASTEVIQQAGDSTNPNYYNSNDANYSVYNVYTNIWREIDNDNLHSLAAHRDLLSKINEKQNGNTPLFLACLRRNFQIVEFLLSVGADPNIECKNATPLFVAILKGEVGIAEDLINHGAITSPVCTNKKVTPLHLAASKGMIESCKLLLDNGADVNALSPKFGTALHVAVSKNHQFITSFLLARNASLLGFNGEGESVFHTAVRCGFLDIVKKLMDLPSINATIKDTIEGNTVLHLACLYNRETIALQLINKYPDLIYVRNNERQTPLFYGSDSIRRAIKLAFINKKQGFISAFNSKTFSDIKYMIENKPIFAHKVIIKHRSPILFNYGNNYNSKEIIIKDIEHVVFHAFLLYLYTDLLQCDKSLYSKLKDCAEKFGVVRLKKLCQDAMSKTLVEVPPSSFQSDMEKAIDSPEFSDVTFLVENKPLQAHRTILCQSSYFRAMLEPGRLRESNQKEIPILDINYDVFEILVYYAYTAEMKEVTPEKAVEVLQAIDYFQFSEGLRHCCEAYLCSCINKETVCQLFALADQCASIFLKEECFDFIVTHYKHLSTTQEFMGMGSELQNEVEEYLKRQQELKQTKSILQNKQMDKNFSLL